MWFAEILEELISFVVVCFCLSLSGTSFTDIPVYCWQLLLNKIIFSLPSRSFLLFSEDFVCDPGLQGAGLT